MINNLNIVVEEAPTILLISNMILPKKMKDIENVANKLTREGYNLLTPYIYDWMKTL